MKKNYLTTNVLKEQKHFKHQDHHLREGGGGKRRPALGTSASCAGFGVRKAEPAWEGGAAKRGGGLLPQRRLALARRAPRPRLWGLPVRP